MSWPVKDYEGHPDHIARATRLEEVGGLNSSQEAGKCPESDSRCAGDVGSDDVGDGRDAGDVDNGGVGDGRDAADVDNDDVGDVNVVICQSR